MTRAVLWRAHRVLLFVMIALTAALAAYGTTVAVRGPRHPAPVVGVALPAAVTKAAVAPHVPARVPAAPVPPQTGVAKALAGAIKDPALGARLLAHVVDAATGQVLFDREGATPAAPASTAKLLVAAAVLGVHAPTDRFTTTVVAGRRAGTVVLVGGGDPTLTAATGSRPGAYPEAARLSALATQVRARHVRVTRVVVDGSLFRGPTVSPAWAPEDVPTGYGAPITAVMVDGGRAQPSDFTRSGTPDLAAGQAFARALGRASVPVERGTAPQAGQVLGRVRSAPLSVLLEQMLLTSDNVIAEVLARQVAIAQHAPASFLGAAAAVRDVLAGLGARVGSGMVDGSGLAARDRVSPAALTQVLRLMTGAGSDAGPDPAAAANVRFALGALPVAGWSGTLATRYGTSPDMTAAGRIRAKTGTLTGVSSLAGVVRDRSGRLLVFALDADRAPPGGSYGADAALDRVATVLATCGCS